MVEVHDKFAGLDVHRLPKTLSRTGSSLTAPPAGGLSALRPRNTVRARRDHQPFKREPSGDGIILDHQRTAPLFSRQILLESRPDFLDKHRIGEALFGKPRQRCDGERSGRDSSRGRIAGEHNPEIAKRHMRKLIRIVVVIDGKHLRMGRKKFEKRLSVGAFRRRLHRHRIKPDEIYLLHRYLRAGIERAQAFKFITEELRADRAFVAGAPRVKDSASHRKFTG